MFVEIQKPTRFAYFLEHKLGYSFIVTNFEIFQLVFLFLVTLDIKSPFTEFKERYFIYVFFFVLFGFVLKSHRVYTLNILSNI